MILEKQIQEAILDSFELCPADLANLITDFTLKPPKEFPPTFMLKSTSFISKRTWKDILVIAADRLTQLGCECVFQNFSLECVFYNERRCVNIPFRVNVFTSEDSDNEYVVQIQNRSSENTFEFWGLFEQFVDRDEEGGIIHQSKNKPDFQEPLQGSALRRLSSSRDTFRPIILSDISS